MNPWSCSRHAQQVPSTGISQTCLKTHRASHPQDLHLHPGPPVAGLLAQGVGQVFGVGWGCEKVPKQRRGAARMDVLLSPSED